MAKGREQAPEAKGGKIEGRNAVLEALRAGLPVDKIYLAKGTLPDASIQKITAAARTGGAVIVEADKRKLDAMSETGSHQGVIAIAAVQAYATVQDILQRAKDRREAPLVVVCDEISDPHNLGAIIRTAEAAGAHGIIIPKRRSVGLTAVVGKTSAGAVSYLPVARVANLPALLKQLKEAGLWVYGSGAEGDMSLYEIDFRGPTALVIGSEGAGMGRLVRETCDVTVNIPMKGQISSLNASAAAAVLLYEVVRQRLNG